MKTIFNISIYVLAIYAVTVIALLYAVAIGLVDASSNDMLSNSVRAIIHLIF